MKEQTKDFLIGILIIGLIAVGGYYLLTKGVYNPYGYKQVKPTGTYSLDTTQWRIPKNDTVLYISDKYHVHKVVIIFSDSAY